MLINVKMSTFVAMATEASYKTFVAILTSMSMIHFMLSRVETWWPSFKICLRSRYETFIESLFYYSCTATYWGLIQKFWPKLSSKSLLSLTSNKGSGSKVRKKICLAQLSMKFILLINVKMPITVGILTLISRINTTSERLKARNFFICWYFSFNEQLKFLAQLSWAWKKINDLGAWFGCTFLHVLSGRTRRIILSLSLYLPLCFQHTIGKFLGGRQTHALVL